MLGSLLDKKSYKKFSSLCDKIAEIDDRKRLFEKQFMQLTTKETIYHVLEIVEKCGHPDEVNKSKALRRKYEAGEGFVFEDIVMLEGLYKSNYDKDDNKDEPDE